MAKTAKKEADIEWTTKDGRKIKVKDLTDSHLLNIQRMLCQQVEDEKHYSSVIGTFWAPQGEMAQDAFEYEWGCAMQAVATAVIWLMITEPEIEKRGLEPLPLKNPYEPLPTPLSVEHVKGGTIARFK